MSDRARIEFLDAVRAVSALLVVASHFRGSARMRDLQHSVVNLGTAGVLAFFLCSGFIIPRSIERARSPQAFWTNRLFRLWPAYLVTLGVVVVVTHVLDTGFGPQVVLTPASVFANASMLTGVIGTPIIDQSWTLTFELQFYAMATILFAAGLLRHSVAIMGAAMAGTVAAGLLPAVNGDPYRWSWAYWLTTMFVGLVVHDATIGRFPRWVGWAALAGGVLSGEVALNLGGHTEAYAPSFRWTLAFGYGLFAAGLALADRSFPRWLSYLGRISYSMYLSHILVIHFVPDTGFGPASAAVWLGASVLVADLGYRFVELPMINLGRQLAAQPSPAHLEPGAVLAPEG